MAIKNDFLKYQAQTSPYPFALEIKKAKGSYIIDSNGKKYLDFVAGVSANTLGHQPRSVHTALKKQLRKYTHVMVYGEFIQEPVLQLCKKLAEILPAPLETTYLTNSGTEATEGALKLAKKVTKRSKIIAFKNAYHGNTMGSMSVCGSEIQNRSYRPLVPGVQFIQFNKFDDLSNINTDTAAVIVETIQGGAGFIVPQENYLKDLRKKCDETGTLLILDEIQSGIGRTGKWFGFMHYNIVPDIIVTGKGLGGGLPIGAFIASHKHMQVLKENPILGHITTFGGHPLIATAALATLQTLDKKNILSKINDKELLFRKLLTHSEIKEIRGKGLMLALILENESKTQTLVKKALDKGLILFFLLYEKKAVRITPPLNIKNTDIIKGCRIIIDILNSLK